MSSLVFAVCAATAGAAQASLLARDARGHASPLGFVLRLALVSAVLVWAALSGQLLLGTLAWFSAFVLAGIVVYRRLR